MKHGGFKPVGYVHRIIEDWIKLERRMLGKILEIE